MSEDVIATLPAATMKKEYQRLKMIQEQLQLQTTNSSIQSTTKRERQKRTRDLQLAEDESQMEMEEEKARMTDEVASVADLSSTVVQPATKKAKLEVKEEEIATNEKSNHSEPDSPESGTEMDGEEAIHLDQYSYQLKTHMGTSSDSPGPLTSLLLDAAMDLGDLALCLQFATLLFMRNPPLDLNSKSMIHGDTIGMRLFHLIQRVGYAPIPAEVAEVNDDSNDERESFEGYDSYERLFERHRKMERELNAPTELTGSNVLRPHDEQMKELMLLTIDPHITNRQGQTMLHVISDATYYSLSDPSDPGSARVNHQLILTKDLVAFLIQRGANLLARDHAGKVAIVELTRNHLLIGLDMDHLIDLVMRNNPVELLNAANSDDGATLLRVSGYTSDQSVLLDRLVGDRDLFRQIEFADPEFDLEQLQAENDATRESFIQSALAESSNPRDHSEQLLDEVKRYEAIESAVHDWIQFNRKLVSNKLDPFFIPDLAAIVTEYWVGCDERESSTLVSLKFTDRNSDARYYVLDLPTDRTLESLWSHILNTISRHKSHHYTLSVEGLVIKTDDQVQALTTGQRIILEHNRPM